MDKNEIDSLLDDFFSGEMTDQEKKNFFDLLEEDTNLKKAYGLEKRIVENALAINDRVFKGKIQNIHENYIKKNERTNSMSTRTWIGVAASLIILTAAYFLIVSDSDQGGGEQKNQYLAYLSEYETTSLGKYSLRGGDVESKTLKDTLAMALHESTNGSMEKAKTLLQDLLTRYPNNEEIQLYLGIQHFKDANYSVAIKMLNKLVLSNDVDIKEEAEMALAMASSSLSSDNSLSIKWLKKIANTSNHRHREMAENQLSLYE